MSTVLLLATEIEGMPNFQPRPTQLTGETSLRVTAFIAMSPLYCKVTPETKETEYEDWPVSKDVWQNVSVAKKKTMTRDCMSLFRFTGNLPLKCAFI